MKFRGYQGEEVRGRKKEKKKGMENPERQVRDEDVGLVKKHRELQ